VLFYFAQVNKRGKKEMREAAKQRKKGGTVASKWL